MENGQALLRNLQATPIMKCRISVIMTGLSTFTLMSAEECSRNLKSAGTQEKNSMKNSGSVGKMEAIFPWRTKVSI